MDDEFEIIRFKVPARFAPFCEAFGELHPKLQAQGLPAKHAAFAALGVALCRMKSDTLPADVTANALGAFAHKLIEVFIDLDENKPNPNIKNIKFSDEDLDKIEPKGAA